MKYVEPGETNVVKSVSRDVVFVSAKRREATIDRVFGRAHDCGGAEMIERPVWMTLNSGGGKTSHI